MSATSFFSLLDCAPAGKSPAWGPPDGVRRAVTISRQAGCGAQEIAGKLAARLQAHGSHTGLPWTIFDHKLMEKVLGDPRLPQYFAAFLPEERNLAMTAILNELFAGHPAPEAVIRQTAETMLRLAEVGNVILLGRGSNVVAARVPHVLHVRLVSPLGHRVQRVHELYGMARQEAQDFCLREEADRAKYVRTHYHADVNDPLAYHLVINTALMSFDAAARQIEDALLSLEDFPKSGENWMALEIDSVPV